MGNAGITGIQGTSGIPGIAGIRLGMPRVAVGAAHIGNEVNGISAGVTVGFSWALQYGEVGPSGCPFNPRLSTLDRSRFLVLEKQ